MSCKTLTEMVLRLLILNSHEGVEELKGFHNRSSTESDVIFWNARDGGRVSRWKRTNVTLTEMRDDIILTAPNNSSVDMTMG